MPNDLSTICEPSAWPRVQHPDAFAVAARSFGLHAADFFAGAVTNLRKRFRSTEVSGWAYVTANPLNPLFVLLFARGRLVGSVVPHLLDPARATSERLPPELFLGFTMSAASRFDVDDDLVAAAVSYSAYSLLPTPARHT